MRWLHVEMDVIIIELLSGLADSCIELKGF